MHTNTMKIFDHITLRDYFREKDAATDRIVRRQSRGNVAAQNGWVMTKEKLKKLSVAADDHMTHLLKITKKAS